jgi:tetratricopeptide (TPR) repeat protein
MINNAIDLFLQADELIKQNAISEALELLSEVIRVDPSFGKAYNHIGFIYETKYSDYERAEEFYKQALEITPEYAATYYNYSVLLSTLKRSDDLLDLLEKAGNVPGIDISRIYNEYGILYEGKGEYDTAVEWYKKAAKEMFADEAFNRALASVERCQKKKEIL